MLSTFDDVMKYITSAFSTTKTVVGALWAFAMTWIFPERSFLVAFVVVLVAAIIDTLTRYVAQIKKAGSLYMAIKTKTLSSDRMWQGIAVKLYTYFIIAILVGLSYNVVYIREASVFAGSLVYTVLFLRETQSIIENLIETGADLGWLAAFVKRKEEEILNKGKIDINTEKEIPAEETGEETNNNKPTV